MRKNNCKTAIYSEDAPKPVGPYEQAVKASNILFVSGQLAIRPESGEFLNGDVRAQTRLVLRNIENILKAAGGSLEDVAKTTVYINDMNDFKEVNEIYAEVFKNTAPARSCVACRLINNMKVEIDAIAVL